MTIAHATALSPEEFHVFEHALALACAADARLFTVHARDGSEGESPATPDARSVLASWGRNQHAVEHEAFIHSCCEDPIDTLLDALKRVAPDLIVAGTHQRGRAERLFGGSQCEALLRNVTQPTLVFPLDARSLVTPDGSFELRRIVVPVGDEVTAKAAVERAVWLGTITGATALDINLIFVGDEADAPRVTLPGDHAGWTVHRTTSHQSGVAAAVVEAAGAGCVVVMATRGADSLRDSLFGTNAEHVVRLAKCPVLVTPV